MTNQTDVFEILPNLPVEQYRTGEYAKHINSFNNYMTRAQFTRNHAWSIYTKESMDAIADVVKTYFPHNKCIDVAGGMGLLTKLLRDRGLDVTLNDISATGEGEGHKYWYIRANQFAPVDIVSSAAEVDYDDYNVAFMSWPCCDANWDHFVLDKLKPGTLLIYLGEGSGGCTGSGLFHERLRKYFHELDTLSEDIEEHHVRFYSMHDRWHVYRKLNKPFTN